MERQTPETVVQISRHEEIKNDEKLYRTCDEMGGSIDQAPETLD